MSISIPTLPQDRDDLCKTPDNLQLGYLLFRSSPILAMPVYGFAVYLLVCHSPAHLDKIRVLYMRNLFFNVLSMITITWILCPMFYLPMIGYRSNGIIKYIDINLAIPPCLTIYGLFGVTVSILHLFHYRLIIISKMSNIDSKPKIKQFLNFLVKLTYSILFLTCVSYFGTISIPSYQNFYKPKIYEKYRIAEVFCPEFLVADPFSWQIILVLITTVIYIFCAAITIVLCGGFTLIFLLTSRSTISRRTMSAQQKFTAIMICQATVHTIFILAPIFCIAAAIYFDIWIRDGGLALFMVESQQGTASTIIFIFTHSASGKIFQRFPCCGKKMKKKGSNEKELIWRTSKLEMRSFKSVVL